MIRMFLCKKITEREICETAGPVAQFAAYRPLNVPKQLSSIQSGETYGSQVYRWFTHKYNVLPNEGKSKIEGLIRSPMNTAVHIQELYIYYVLLPSMVY